MLTEGAAEKLRAQGRAAPALTVFIQTNPFDERRAFYTNASTRAFPVPTQDSRALIEAAIEGARSLVRRGDAYHKAGVLLPELVPGFAARGDLLSNPADSERSERLMDALDQINQRFGRGSLRFGGELAGTGWQRRAHWVSPISTTRWGGLPWVRA